MKRLLLSCCLLVGCASSLAPRFTSPVAPTEAVVAAQLSAPRPRKERAVVVGISHAPEKLIAWDLTSATKLWEQSVNATSAPLVAGNAVVLHESHGITVRDLATGNVRAELDDEGKLIGADGIGDTLIVSIGYGEGERRGTIMLVDGSHVRWIRTLTQPAGTPALLGDQVLLPWGTQRLSVLSAADGQEIARWTFKNSTIGQARVVGTSAYVGQHSFMRVDKDIPAHTEGPFPAFAPFKRALPAQPPVLRDGYAAVPAPDAAEQKLGVVWQVNEADGQTRAVHDLLALRFYRVVFGMSAVEDKLRWVQTFDHDIVGASVDDAGLWLVDDTGSVRLFDAQGALLGTENLGTPLKVATFRAAGLAAASSASQPADHAATLHDQLLTAARVSDDRLVLARAYAVEQLGHSPEASATGELIDLCATHEQPEPVRLSACKALATRDSGQDQVLAALRRRGSFLENTPAPPAGALAQAAAHLSLRNAGPSLIVQAEDPNTPAADLALIFQAFDQLGQASAIPLLDRFVRLHHAEPPGSELAPAIHAAIVALGDLRARAAKSTLEYVTSDPLTMKDLRDQAHIALVVLETPPAPKAEPVAKAAKTAPEAAKTGPVTYEPEEEVQVDARQYALDLAAVWRTLKPVHPALERCLSADATKAPSARVSMIVAGDGRIEGLIVTPSTLQACMEPILRDVRFPATRLGRQHISHTVQPALAVEKPAPEPATAKKPAAKAAGKPAAPAGKLAAPAAKPAAPAQPKPAPAAKTPAK